MAALAGIGQMPDTIEDRAVIVKMRRRAPGEHVQPYRHRRDGPDLRRLALALRGWLRADLATLTDAEPPMPVEDRAADTWEPLVAVADFAAGTWPERARTAAESLCAERHDSGPAPTSAAPPTAARPAHWRRKPPPRRPPPSPAPRQQRRGNGGDRKPPRLRTRPARRLLRVLGATPEHRMNASGRTPSHRPIQNGPLEALSGPPERASAAASAPATSPATARLVHPPPGLLHLLHPTPRAHQGHEATPKLLPPP